MRYGLLFERFLNPERVSMPDFDIDFCQERRDEVISYVTREYGADRVAQIITFGKLQARAAVRDVGRVLGLPYGQVNKVAELIPNNPAKPVTLQQAIDGELKLRDLRDSDEGLARLMEIALQLEGLYRHASTHAAGVVIGDRKLNELVPLYKDPRSEMLVTQFSMKYVEQAGLVKFDFLGLTTLTVLDRALKFLKLQGITIDLATLPMDDKKTYDMIARGDTAGVFTFETQGYRSALQQMRPDRFEDLVAIQALNRPGPMANIPDYCARKRGAEWTAPDPSIHHILAETYGVIVYQEQVMQIAQVMAGYSLAGADLLRRAMGKKIRAEMDAQRIIFCEGAVKQGNTVEKANEIFDLMAKFADYGFNKSHAAAYALVSYQTAYLRANHPVEFLAACMSLSIANTEKLATLRVDAERTGIRVLPPDINRSDSDFKPERQEDGTLAIRYALGAIKRVGIAAMADLVKARGEKPFKDLTDFASRIDAKSITAARSKSSPRPARSNRSSPAARKFLAPPRRLSAPRRRLPRNAIPARSACSAAARRSRCACKTSRNGLRPIASRSRPRPSAFISARIRWTCTRSPSNASAWCPRPASRAAPRRAPRVSNSRARWAQKRNASPAPAAAWPGSRSRTARAVSRLRCSRKCSRACANILTEGTALLVTADIKMDGESLRITTTDVTLLDDAASKAGASLRIWLDRTEALPHISALLEREGKGRGRVTLVPKTGLQRDLDVVLPGGFNVSPRLAQAMKMVPGVEMVEDI